MQLHREAVRDGEFTVDFHFLINKQGMVSTGRKHWEVADYVYNDYEKSIVIVADSPNKLKLTDGQNNAIEEVVHDLKVLYPDVKVIKVKNEIDIVNDLSKEMYVTGIRKVFK